MTDREGATPGGYQHPAVPAGEETDRGRRGGLAALLVAAVAVVVVALIVWWVLADDESVLVVTDPRQAQSQVLDEGQNVRVTGTVRLFEFDEFEGIGTGDDFGDFDGTPVIVARSIQPVAGDAGEEGADVLERIGDEDTALVGRQVTVTGEVAERVGVASFLLEDD